MSTWQNLTTLLDAAPGTWSMCVRGAGGSELYGYEARALRSAASLIKVPLALALYTTRPELLDQVVEVTEQDKVEGEGALDAAPIGTTRTVRELVTHALCESDNTASNLLIRLVGMDAVNGWLERHGVATRVGRRFMDFAALAAGRDNRTSAADMAALLALLLEPRYAEPLALLRRAVGTGKLEAGLPEGTPLAHKVGDLPGVEHDAGIVWAPSGPYIVVVLGVDLVDAAAGRAVIAAASRIVWERMAELADMP